MLSLAVLGLCPQHYEGSIIERLIRKAKTAIGVETPLCIDQTKFSSACRNELVDDFAVLAASNDALEEALIDAAKELSSNVLQDPLLCGWAYQAQIGAKVSTKERPKESSQTRESDIAFLTQWFTPDWISTFLVDQTLTSKTSNANSPVASFWDPACGAGHILIRALEKMAVADGENLHQCLDNLFGCDIDSVALQLASTAVYLKCRSIELSAPRDSLSELPLPKLFYVSSSPSYPTECGSLLLGIGQDFDRSKLKLKQLNGTEHVAQEVLPEHFSCIATNPPYLSHRLLPFSISELLRKHYKHSRYDLYAAFIDLCLRKLRDDGRFGMICQQSFLTIQRYKKLREILMSQCGIDSLVMLGSGSFAMRAGEKVNNAIIVAQKMEADRQDEITVKYWRLLGNLEKLEAEQKGIGAVEFDSISDSDLRTLSSSIDGAPIVPWCPAPIAKLFTTLPALENKDGDIRLVNGLFTCNNSYFVSHHRDVVEGERHLYVPYDKGGGHKWYKRTPYMLRWEGDGKRIREYRSSRGQSSKLPGEEFYFKTGITYSYIGTRDFRARLLSPGSIFDIASSAVFSESVDIYYLLGFLNSTLARYMLFVLNPTINFQIGDLRRLPFAKPDKSTEVAVSKLATEAVELAMQLERYDSDSPDFVEFVNGAKAEAKARFDAINKREWAIQDEIDQLIYALYKIDSTTRRVIAKDPMIKRSAKTALARFANETEQPPREVAVQ